MKIILAIIRPFLSYLSSILSLTKLYSKYPTIKVSGKVNVQECSLGIYNYLSTNVSLYNTSLGDFSYCGANTSIKFTSIGKFCCIGPHVQIGLGHHPVDTFVSIHPIFYSLAKQVGITFADKNYFEEYKNTEIGNDVWIGANVVIPGGVKIGDGAIIASGAVITKDIPPYSIVGGVPGKVIKYRFSDEQIEMLLKLKWWDKDTGFLRNNFKAMHDVNTLKGSSFYENF